MLKLVYIARFVLVYLFAYIMLVTSAAHAGDEELEHNEKTGFMLSSELQAAINAYDYVTIFALAKTEMQQCEKAVASDPELDKDHCFKVRQEALFAAISLDEDIFAIEQSERLLADAIGSDDTHLEARLTAINILSVAYGEIGDFDKAFVFLQMDLDASIEIFGANSEETAISLMNIGIAYDHSLNQHEKGLRYYQKAEEALKKGGLENGPSMALALSHQGRAYDNLQLLFQSIDYYERSITLIKSLSEQEQYNLPITQQNYAVVLNQTGHWAEAQAALRRAQSGIERIYGAKSQRLNSIRLAMVSSFVSQGRYSDAKALLDTLGEAIQQDRSLVIAPFVVIKRAQLATAQRQFEISEMWLTEAETLLTENNTDNPDFPQKIALIRAENAYLLRDYLEIERQISSLLADADLPVLTRVDALKWQGEYQLTQENYEGALIAFEQARELGAQSLSASAPLIVILDSKIAYSRSRLSKQSGNETADRLMANAAERARTSLSSLQAAAIRSQGAQNGYRSVFLDQLDMIWRAGGGLDLDRAMIPAQALFWGSAAAAGERLQNLAAQSNDRLAKLVRERDIVREKLRWIDRKARAQDSNIALELADNEKKLTQQIIAIDPEFDMRVVNSDVTLASVQARLGKDEVLLVLLADEQRGYHIWAITQQDAQWSFMEDEHLQRLRPALADINAFYKTDIATNRGQAKYTDNSAEIDALKFKNAQAYISKALLGQVADKLRGARHIHIVSTGEVGSLPLASLSLDDGYVLDIAPVSRYSSLAAFVASERMDELETKAVADMAVLAIAPDYAKIPGYASLPYARQQVEFLDELGFASVKYMSGEQAKEQDFKQSDAIADADLILFASHSVFIEGEGTAFVLHKSANEDGALTSKEIALLPTNAKLVILSACSTSAADPDEVDPLSGMARGFLLSGSKGIMISHWPVDDKATAQFSSLMLGYLADNPGALNAEALRYAALSLRNQGGAFAHPRYWGAFSLLEE